MSIYETGVTQPVSDGNTHNSVVGKQMILTASFASPQPAGPVQWNWNINGTIVRDYRVVQQDSLTKPGLAPIPWTAPSPQSANPTESTTFYWVAGSTAPLTVTVQAFTANGNQESDASAVYNVEAPTGVGINVQTNPVRIGPNYDPRFPDEAVMSLGTQENAPHEAGVYTTAAALAPADYGGLFSATQTLNYQNTYLCNQNVHCIPGDSSGGNVFLDDCPLYVTYPNDEGGANRDLYTHPGQPVSTYNQATNSPLPGYQIIDAPDVGIGDDYSYVQAQESFLTYFMFRPTETSANGALTPMAHAIWVPLGYFSWNFDASANNQGGKWSIVNAAANPNPITGTVFSNGTVSFPQWSGTAPGLSSFCQYPKDDIVTRDLKRGSRTPGSQHSIEPRGGLQ